MNITHLVRIAAASLAMATLACGPATEAHQQSGALVIDDAWAATTNPGATVGAGYVTIRNTGATADRLLSARSTRANRVELHEMSMANGMMRMQPVQAIVIPAGGSVTLQPSGLHIMFLDISAPFTDGARIPATLHFERQGDVQIEFVARPRGSAGHEH